MWTRKQLKDNAKEVLSKYYWTAFAVSLIMGLVAGSSSGGGFSFGYSRSPSETEELIEGLQNLDSEDLAILLVALGVFFLFMFFVWAICMVFKIFVQNPLRVGKFAYYIRQREDCGKFGNLVISFKKGKYKGSVLTMFLKDLYITLWTMLFIIPGIIKSYSYFMVPYILADNPELPASRVFEISKKAMKGHKWNLFVLQLSFILWELACICTCGIGFLFLAPYQEATYAELYACLKTKAMRDGIITEGELPRSLWNDSSVSSTFE